MVCPPQHHLCGVLARLRVKNDTEDAMGKSQALHSLKIIQSCLSCPAREDGLFCHLGPEALARLDSIRQTITHPKGTEVFVQGQQPRGLYVLCSGRVKLTAASTNGRSLIVRVAVPGEVLGLSAVMSNAAYDVNATTLEPCQVNFIPRDSFLSFLQGYGEVSVRVAQHLSVELRRAYHQVARIALASTARAKLAGLLLEWAERDDQPASPEVRFQLRMTHEEIGELVGSSRETIARILSDFRRRGLIQIEGTSITIPDRGRLEKLLS